VSCNTPCSDPGAGPPSCSARCPRSKNAAAKAPPAGPPIPGGAGRSQRGSRNCTAAAGTARLAPATRAGAERASRSRCHALIGTKDQASWGCAATTPPPAGRPTHPGGHRQQPQSTSAAWLATQLWQGPPQRLASRGGADPGGRSIARHPRGVRRPRLSRPCCCRAARAATAHGAAPSTRKGSAQARAAASNCPDPPQGTAPHWPRRPSSASRAAPLFSPTWSSPRQLRAGVIA